MHLTINQILLCIIFCALYNCANSPAEDAIEELQMLSGTITYPFVKTSPLGVNQPEEKFIIKTVVGEKQYIIEIPKAGREYDIEIPIAAFDDITGGASTKEAELSSPHLTDAELTNNMPQMKNSSPKKTTILNKAFGTSPASQSKEDPSFIIGISKINQFFVNKKFSYCLIEINYLLSHYPNSILLHKKKGTVLIKLGKHKLAVKAWQKALELSPNDKRLKVALDSLRKRISIDYYD